MGEKMEQAVKREVMEETGLEVESPHLIDVVDNVELDEKGKVKYHFVIIDFFVRLKGGKVEPASDAADLRWVRLDEVQSYVLTLTFKEFFVRNYEKLKGFDSSRHWRECTQ